MSAWLRTTERIAACPLVLLLAACAGVSTPSQRGAITQAPAPQATVMQVPAPGGDPTPFDPAAAWAAAVALALSTSTSGGTVLAQDADPAAQGEPTQAPQEASGVAAKPVVSPRPIAAVQAAPISEAEPTLSTANLPARPASAPATAQGSLVTTAPLRSNPTPPVIAKAPEPAIDVAALKLRLRDTGGIGVFDKLALKRELDNLMHQFRSQHESGQSSGIALLRAPFNALVQKVSGVLRVGDPDLARVILASREGIWAILSDPVKFFAAN